MTIRRLLLFLSLGLFSGAATATTIAFSGPLGVVEADFGGAIYSGVPLGTVFSGSIDDASFNGSISDGTTTTPFGCCIAAGGLSLFNDVVLTADAASFLNALAGESRFSAGMTVDQVDLEGDVSTPTGGRIEVGLSYVLNAGAFANTDPGNYPFDPADLQIALFFITEDAGGGGLIYSGFGKISVIPVPASAWLFTSALGLLGWRRTLVRTRSTSGPT